MAGDASKARTACQDFLAFWKNADTGVATLIAARAEYARLE